MFNVYSDRFGVPPDRAPIQSTRLPTRGFFLATLLP